MIARIFLLTLQLSLSVQAAVLERRQSISNAVDWDPSQTPFPSASRGNVSFTYTSATKGQVQVPDPYHWFEDTNSSANEIKTFRESQVAFANEYLEKANATKNSFQTSLNKANNYTFISLPEAYGPKDDQIYLYWVSDSNDDYDGVYYLANQNELDKAISENYATLPGKPFLDTTLVGINRTVYDLKISPDGKTLLYTIIDIVDLLNVWTYFRNVSDPLTNETTTKNEEGGTGHFPDEVIEQAAITDWMPDSKSIFYMKDEKIKSENSSDQDSVRFHTLGTNAKDDLVIVPPPKNLAEYYDLLITDDTQYLIFFHGQNVNNIETVKMYVASLNQTVSATSFKWLPISVDNSNDFFYITNVGNNFYFQTKASSTNQTLVRFTLDFNQAKHVDHLSDFKMNLFQPRELIPNDANALWRNFGTFDTNKIFLVYLRNDHSELIVHNLETNKQLQNLTLGNFSIVDEIEASPYGKTVFISSSSMNSLCEMYHFDWNQDTNEVTYSLFYVSKTDYINPDDFVVEQIWIPSTDGVQVPSFIMYRKGIQLDGSHPSIIDVYGGYGISQIPSYDQYYFAFAHDFDAVIVRAGVRGGSDVDGEPWHNAGRLGNKQHTFDDVLAVANYLVDQKYATAGKIILAGEASGVMSSAAVVNQAPEGLFGALIAKRGIYDMLRLDISTEASTRIKEYGNPQDPKAFDWIYAYTPLDNIVKNRPYPIIFLDPGKHSKKSENWHPYKFLAELQFLLPKNPFPFFLGDGKKDGEEVKLNSYAIVIHALGLTTVA